MRARPAVAVLAGLWYHRGTIYRRTAMSGFTKQAIQASFLKLLDTYPLRDITVRMITEDCGINRKSFYYHDQDISTSSAPSAKA